MTSSQRLTKQIIIAVIYILIFATTIFIIVVNLFPRRPVVIVEKPDIQSLQIIKSGTVKLDNDKLDFWAEINNPNDDFGASEFVYTFVLQDSEGKEIRKSDKSFILPGDKKRYVLLLNMNPDYKLVNFELSSDSIEWTQLSKIALPELVIRNVSLGTSIKAGNKFTLFGILTNASPVNLKNIQVIAILTDGNGSILGVNQTSIRDVLTSESRDFEMIWNNEIANTSAVNTTIYAQSNILKDKELLIQLQPKPIFDR
jgi:hypothetical protein